MNLDLTVRLFQSGAFEKDRAAHETQSENA
jgi:hypothetical protein